MPRLFTAIEIPPLIRQHLALMRGPLAGARWIEADDMHITLRFVGDIDGRAAEEFSDMLAGVHARPFSITIKGVGAFGGRDPRVLWAGVEAGEEMEALYRGNDRAARAAGIEPALRDFKPHVTLARMRGARQHTVARWLEEYGDLRTEPFLVTQFVLLSARPGSGGPPYGAVEEFPFAGLGD